jgi:mono/diheme cytochrome c family protein
MKLTLVLSVSALLSLLVYNGCQSDSQIEFSRYYSAGQVIYQSRCQNCHGTQGQGLAALIPPLTDTAYLRANERNLACFLKNGLKVPISINGKTFVGEMPPSNLAPMEIAQVLTYVRNTFGNKSGLYNVTATGADLKRCN